MKAATPCPPRRRRGTVIPTTRSSDGSVAQTTARRALLVAGAMLAAGCGQYAASPEPECCVTSAAVPCTADGECPPDGVDSGNPGNNGASQMPYISINSAPPAVTSASEVMIAFSVSPPVDAMCRLDDGIEHDCLSPKIFRATTEGEHVAEIRAGAAQRFVRWTLDRTPPALAVTLSLATAGSDTLLLSFTSEVGATAYCRLNSGPWLACTSPRYYYGLPPGTHTACVQASDTVGNRSDAVCDSAIIPEPAPPPSPLLTAPANGRFWGLRSAAAPDIPISWQPVAGATSYRLQIATTIGFVSNLVDVVVTSTAYTWPAPPVGRFHWRVIAQNSAGTATSETRLFDTSYANPIAPLSPFAGYDAAAANGLPPPAHIAGSGTPRRALVLLEHERSDFRFMSDDLLAIWLAGYHLVVLDVEYAFRRPGLRAKIAAANPSTIVHSYVPFFVLHDTICGHDGGAYYFRHTLLGNGVCQDDLWYRNTSNLLWAVDWNQGFAGTPPLNLGQPVNLVARFREPTYLDLWSNAVDALLQTGETDGLMIDYLDNEVAGRTGGYASISQYDQAIADVVAAALNKTAHVWGNKGFRWTGTTHSVYTGAVGWMAEHAIATVGRSPWWNSTESEWDNNAKKHFEALAGQVGAGGFAVLAPDLTAGAEPAAGDSSENLPPFRFQFISSLIIAPSAYISYDYGPFRHGNAWLYAEQYAPLGAASTFTSSGTLRIRSFANGYAVVNTSRSNNASWTPPVAVQRLSDPFRDGASSGNTGATVSGSITLGPEDGVIVLKAP